jgi:hypothetical protein
MGEAAGQHELEQVTGGGVGPVGVLDDQQDRPLGGHGVEGEGHGRQDVGALAGVVDL